MILSRFQLSDVVSATDNFSETYCIESDANGVVYIAELVDFHIRSLLPFEGKNTGEFTDTQNTVAIKRMSGRENGKGKEKYYKEIEMRSSYKHPNIVSLLGFCDEGDEMILIYEHAFHKTLDDYLTRVDNLKTFTWTERLHMCLEIARGLDHLHTKMGDQRKIVHGDIKSANILIGDNRETKISYFGISKLLSTNHGANTHVTDKSACTKVYLGPEYEKTGKLKIESDIYSFGVVLFEIFCGRVAYDPVYLVENDKGLAHIVLQCFNDGTLQKMIDPKLKEETYDDICSSNKGPNQDSLDTFTKIAHQCLEEVHAKRPTMAIVIKELEIALNFQENLLESLQISLKDIEMVTNNFNKKNYVGSGRYWKAYRGELSHANRHITIVAKRWDSKSGKGDKRFQTELDVLFKLKHENIVGLVGYCNEMNEKIIIYEHATNKSLDMYLDDASLTWMIRLKICIDVASGLEFLHGGIVTLKKVVHRDIKSTSILLTGDWKAKISNLEFCSLDSLDRDMEHVTDNANGTLGYLDPEYKRGFLTEKSDIYSFGVILLELLCGRLACGDDGRSLPSLAKHHFVQGNIDEMVFRCIREQIDPKSLNTFVEIMHKCLHDDGYKRPKASEVVIQLKKALEFQEDYEIWEPKLPKDYKEIFRSFETPENYMTEKKKDLHKKLTNGILLQKENMVISLLSTSNFCTSHFMYIYYLCTKNYSEFICNIPHFSWFTMSDSGITNKMISATMFSYEKSESRKWRSVHNARFRKVAKISDTSNLKIQITTNNQFLSPGVVYGAYLIFKFCESRKVSSNPIYVNLNFRQGSETLHSYFATWRDDEWMMTELFWFLNDNDDIDFAVLLESFSRYYCGNSAIYVQGIEFRAIENASLNYSSTLFMLLTSSRCNMRDIENQKEVQQIQMSNLIDQVHQIPTNNDVEDEKAWLLEINGKKYLMLSAEEVLYNSPKLKPFSLKRSSESRFRNVIELLPQQVFRIKYRIESRMLSPFTEYACCLVFKLSENCRGLHCPIKVQDLLNRRNKERKIIYFRSPSASNLHDANWIPKQRNDGWMEVIIWTFNSKYKLGNNVIRMNLKLITYEENMAGLIICGLNFRPI
ncbi:uncharacterized protein [Rutidosis leptorrhynchoides]|uniref:uncharacterized protein n=1 Tax=Rutidosis leptorrhynchoides TaxID=125765 RepID=UPI003A99B607